MRACISDIIEVKIYVEGVLTCICGSTGEVLVPVTLLGDVNTGEINQEECGDAIYCPVCERKHRVWEDAVKVANWRRYRFQLVERFYTAEQVLNRAARQRGMGGFKFHAEVRR